MADKTTKKSRRDKVSFSKLLDGSAFENGNLKKISDSLDEIANPPKTIEQPDDQPHGQPHHQPDNRTANHTDNHTTNRTTTPPTTPTANRTDNRTANHTYNRTANRTDNHTAIRAGFSLNQTKMIEFLYQNSPIELTYEDLREYCSLISKDSARDVCRILERKDILIKKRVRRGVWTGIRLVLNSEKNDFFEKIIKNKNEDDKPNHTINRTDNHTDNHTGNHTDNQPDQQPDQQPDGQPDLKIDRESNIKSIYQEGGMGGENNLSSEENLLSITDEDIAFFWPEMHKNGFTESQIKQLIGRYRKVGKSVDLIPTYLDYAEFELKHGMMLDANKKPVKKPVSYLFQSLSQNGCYRRPEGYISPEEQREKEKIAEAQKIKKLQKEREDLEFENWLGELSEEEKEKILKKSPTGKPGEHGKKNYLRHYWQSHVKGDK